MIQTINFGKPSELFHGNQGFTPDTCKFKDMTNPRHNGGVPLVYDIERGAIAIDASDSHSLVFSATGSLKSRAIVMPTVKILGYAGESMIISDPKGEIYSKLADELKQNDYNIVVINLRNPAVGNAWNPLNIPFQFYLEGNIDKAAECVNDIAYNIALAERSSDDPFWDYAASDMAFGLVMLLFRYCKKHGLITNAINISNLLALKRKLFERPTQAQNTQLWKYAAEDELTATSLSGSVFAPNDTLRSILAVFDEKFRAFAIQPMLMDMLANNDFDIGDIGRKKTAVFLITPDEKSSYHRLVSLFIKQSYEYLIYTATLNKDNRVEKRINYILDEFSSLPAIGDFPTMISAARSRDIRFLLVVQSKNQLIKRYHEEAETIISNCTNWIFFTSRELHLLKELSELCGMQNNGKPNISVYDLQHLSKERCEALVLSGRLKPILVNLLDIDKYKGKKNINMPFEMQIRNARQQLNFELSDSIKQRIRDEMLSRVQNGISSSTDISANLDLKQMNNQFASPIQETNTRTNVNGSIRMEDVIKQITPEYLKAIDARIAEIEEEEEKAERSKFALLLKRYDDRITELEKSETGSED